MLASSPCRIPGGMTEHLPSRVADVVNELLKPVTLISGERSGILIPALVVNVADRGRGRHGKGVRKAS